MTPIKIKIFADGATRDQMSDLVSNPLIKGFTFNPALLRKNGIKSYPEFGREVAYSFCKYPISFEVIADTLKEMEIQAYKIAGWGDNVYVKIPITNTKGESCLKLVESLCKNGVKVNVTAICSRDQARDAVYALAGYKTKSCVSVFAGRIQDTGVCAGEIIRKAVFETQLYNTMEVIWASTRQIYDIFLAQNSGVDIITVPVPLLSKLDMLGQSLEDVSLQTVQMFYTEAVKAGFQI